jgi:hypothetical protein
MNRIRVNRNNRSGHTIRGLSRLAGLLAVLPLATTSGSGATASRAQAAAIRKPLAVRRHGKQWIVTLAPAVRAAVRRYFPGFSTPRFVDFDPDVLENGADVPFAAVADFDGNGLPDIALLLKNHDRQWLLVTLRQMKPGVFRPDRLSHWAEENRKADIDIRVLEGGYAAFPFSSSGGPFHSFPIPHTGIIFEIPGEAGTLYYFKGGRYRHVHFGW